ncbi:PP2C family protein-serine/threonine phosphatase [Streptomyces johnsoniae]|uniref:PP2C family protein-serine/threonine phosphatase n=1 Tax=Streptomyces johnsoniae TaxID=3075532 RepID=A0ABU2SAZ9_9ACTN|nr:PP2C family protein-serine/threonine phosphatase [Streptomyces sp. DSM 41886]MDT0444855.1 PP2C family protein-serine/threonine phosphatase [Streptomyces sp. DSM 41886]
MDRLVAAYRALRTAAPYELLGSLRAVLLRHYAIGEAELRLVDYAMSALRPVESGPDGGGTVSARTGPAGRAFGSQRPFVEPAGRADGGLLTVHLPVSVRGNTTGVLTVRVPRDRFSADVLAELGEIAEALGHELAVADRDTDLYLRAGRTERLTLAAEMQWQLLPGRSCSRPEFDLGGHLEPAYSIRGDNFDWATSAEHLTLSVINGMGEGIGAALLTNLAVNALRNARRAGLGLVEQAYLADQALYGQYRGAAHVAALLLRFELATGLVTVIDAGSPRVWLRRRGAVEMPAFEAQLPLGMFEDTEYRTEQFQVEPGDRLFFLSDGVYDAASPAGERYREKALARALSNSGLLPPAQVPRAVLGELAGYRGGPSPEDDAMVVCLDWRG